MFWGCSGWLSWSCCCCWCFVIVDVTLDFVLKIILMVVLYILLYVVIDVIRGCSSITWSVEWGAHLLDQHGAYFQLGAYHVSMILSHRRDSIMSVWYYISLSNLKYHVSMLVSRRRGTLKVYKFQNFKKSEKILLLKIKFELQFWKVYT